MTSSWPKKKKKNIIHSQNVKLCNVIDITPFWCDDSFTEFEAQPRRCWCAPLLLTSNLSHNPLVNLAFSTLEIHSSSRLTLPCLGRPRLHQPNEIHNHCPIFHVSPFFHLRSKQVAASWNVSALDKHINADLKPLTNSRCELPSPRSDKPCIQFGRKEHLWI